MLWSGATLYPGIVETSPDCIEVVDPDGNLRFVNPAASRVLNGIHATEGEARGEPWSRTWPTEVRPTILAVLSIARSQSASRFFAWRPAAAGEDRYWDVVVTRLIDEHGALRGFLAVSRDATELKRVEEGHELRRRELSHKIKNIFSLVNGLVTLSARGMAVVEPYARTLRDRLSALDRAFAHLHATPDAAATASPQTIRGLLRAMLSPYDGIGGAKRRFSFIDDGDQPIGYTSATSLAMVIHELATNAVKYGALSDAAGTIRVACRRDGPDLHLTWVERGGPAIDAPPSSVGFGSALLSRSVTGQLGGTIAQAWEPDGLTVRMTLSLTCLAR